MLPLTRCHSSSFLVFALILKGQWIWKFTGILQLSGGLSLKITGFGYHKKLKFIKGRKKKICIYSNSIYKWIYKK